MNFWEIDICTLFDDFFRHLVHIHAADAAELTQRPLYRQLLAEKVFRLAVRIRRDEAGRTYEVEELPW